MKILHIAAENVTGTLGRFVNGHESLGHEANYLTFFKGKNQFPEDICLELPMVGPMQWLKSFKEKMGFSSSRVPITGNQNRVIWQPGVVENFLFSARENLWRPIIEKAAKQYGIWDYDIYHLEGGVSFYRDGRDLKELKKQGKKIVTNYHGLDLRVRGAIPAVWELSDLNFTCEFDHYRLYPELTYLFLPFDTDKFPQSSPQGDKIRICHAPRSRAVKGSEKIIDVVDQLSREMPLELILIENKSHDEAIRLKASCHIAIDQIARGDMGYGVNSLESLSMGIPTITNLSEAYQDFIPDHPFVLANEDNLKKVIRELVSDADMRKKYGKEGKDWVIKRHDYRAIAEFIHEKYRELGWERK